MTDTLGRPLRDLRLSVTDRCNFRCPYCMPKEVFGRDFQFLPRAELLTFEEIARLVRVFVQHGVHKVRLTGGEPLVRRHLDALIELLAAIDGVDDLTMTTNGSLLATRAPRLRAAGLSRITISLDTLDDRTFRMLNDVDFPVRRVLEGVDAALEAGFHPVKLNAVVKRGVNDGQSLVELAGFARERACTLRLIEYMDVGSTNGWRLVDVVPAAEMLRLVGAAYPLEPAEPNYVGEVARRYRYLDGGGELGVIASVTQPFCHDCTRARLSARGELYTCLFATKGHDMRRMLRQSASDQPIRDFLGRVWGARADRYSERRSLNSGSPKVEMSHIGG